MTPQHLYLAANYERRQWLREEIAPALRQLGHRITSSWINDPEENEVVADYLRARRADPLATPRNDYFDKTLAHEAMRDWLDLQNSTMLIRFPKAPESDSYGAGKFFESGVATAYGLHVITVGNKECVFDYLDVVEKLETVEELFERLK